jgi:hypothetical protein
MRATVEIFRCVSFGRSFRIPEIRKSRVAPRLITLSVRPTTSSVPKRLIASLRVSTALFTWPSALALPRSIGSGTTWRKLPSAKRKSSIVAAWPSLMKTGWVRNT